MRCVGTPDRLLNSSANCKQTWFRSRLDKSKHIYNSLNILQFWCMKSEAGFLWCKQLFRRLYKGFFPNVIKSHWNPRNSFGYFECVQFVSLLFYFYKSIRSKWVLWFKSFNRNMSSSELFCPNVLSKTHSFFALKLTSSRYRFDVEATLFQFWVAVVLWSIAN